MKRFTRSVCVILIVALMAAVPVCADDGITPYSSSFFMSYDTYFYEASSTTTTTRFRVWFDVTGTGIMEELGASYIEIQRSSDGQNWTVMRTCTPTGYSQMLGYDTHKHVDYISYTGTKGYYYRAYVEFYAKNSTGQGVRSDWTPIYQF